MSTARRKKPSTRNESASADARNQRKPNWPTLVGLLCLLGTVLAVAAYLYIHAPLPPDDDLVDMPLPPITASQYRNTDPSVGYVGSDACVDCHAEQHASYMKTGHSLAMSEIDLSSEPPDGEVVHHRSQRRYVSQRRDGRLWHQEWHIGTGGDDVELANYPLHYGVGSGRFSKSYLVEADGFLIESPITWYTSQNQWDMSPGYDEVAHASFRREITYDCLHCHVGNIESLDGPSDLRFHELAIGCERCHVPGQLHVAERQAGRAVAGDHDDTIVNPQDLPRDLREAICQNCHLSGVVSVAARGRNIADFRPSLRLSDFRHEYGYDVDSSRMTVVGHVEQMHLSRCYQASETLTCTTCHDPHRPIAEEQQVDEHRRACLECHAEQACGLTIEDRHKKSPQDDCVQCHMPQRPTDIPHFAFTHHRIGIHEQDEPKQDEPIGATLKPLVDMSQWSELDQQRSLGLACHRLFQTRSNTEPTFAVYREMGQRILSEVNLQGLLDPAVQASLALLAADIGQFDNAEALATFALQQPDIASDARINALHALEQKHVAAKQYLLAADVLEQIVQVRRDPRDWFLLGVCRQRVGQYPQAIAAYEKTIAIDPGQGMTHQVLASLFEQLGDADKASHHRRLAALLPITGFPE